MAKNIGLIKFTGKLGEYSGRDTAFGYVIQTPGGFKGDRIKTEYRYEKTRQLYSEFGKCATLASLFKRNLDFYLKLLPDRFVYSHIQKRMVAIKECDVLSAKGTKTVGKGLLTGSGAALFRNFSFNSKSNFNFNGFGSSELDLENGRLKFEYVHALGKGFPNSATHLGMRLVLMRVDFEAAACVVRENEFVFVDKGTRADDIILEAEVPEGNGMLIGVLFVGFCSFEVDGIFWRRFVGVGLEVLGVV